MSIGVGLIILHKYLIICKKTKIEMYVAQKDIFSTVKGINSIKPIYYTIYSILCTILQ